MRPTRTLTLALPKTGLQRAPGDLYLADIGIPPAVFEWLGVTYTSLSRNRYWVQLNPAEEEKTTPTGEPE